MKDLLKRSIAGAVYVIITLAATIFHPYAFALVFAVLLYLTISEFYSIANKNVLSLKAQPGNVLAVLMFAIFFLTANNIIPGSFVFLSLLLLLAAFIIELIKGTSNTLKNIAITISGLIYVAVPISLMNFIILPGNAPGSGFYPWILVGIFLILWIYDSMAYITGSLWGKHKIAPSISPGKSWEGFIGGAVFAVIMGILNAVLFPNLSMLSWIVVALLAVTFGTVGDFFESKLKRESGIKDSGIMIPGHGGLLDRLDSLLFAIPVIFIWLNLFGNL